MALSERKSNTTDFKLLTVHNGTNADYPEHSLSCSVLGDGFWVWNSAVEVSTTPAAALMMHFTAGLEWISSG